MRYLAIDHGKKRTGVAICDESETFASPVAVLEISGQALLKKVASTAEEENVAGIVIGLPLNMDDSEGPQAKLVKTFAGQLEKLVSVPIYYQDERLSTFGAEEKLLTAEYTRKKKRKRLDAVAAAQILEEWLAGKSNRQI
jgi:putative Holliday junction resolvase